MRDRIRRIISAGLFAAPLLIGTGVSMPATDLRLVEAVQNQDEQRVRTLLNQRIDVNVRSSDGSTALLWAAHWNALEMAVSLIRAGADPNAANDFRMTPVPVDGEYVFRVHLQRTFQDVIRGLNEANDIEVPVDGIRVGHFKLGGGAELAAQAAADYRDVRPGTITNGDDALQVRVPMNAGLRTVTATLLKANDILPEGLGPARIPIWSREGDVPTVPAYISSLLIGGPYNGRVPKDPAIRSRIFGACVPT